MKKDQVLKSVVLLQAVCMIVLAVVVVTRVLSPPSSAVPKDNDPQDGADPSKVEEKVAATVGTEQITNAELEEQLRGQYGDSVLRTLMVRAAIRLEARAYDLHVSADELSEELNRMMAGYEDKDQYYTTMKEQLGLTPEAIRKDTEYRLLLEKIAIRPIEVTESDVDAYISENEEQFAPQTQVRLAWIVLDNNSEAEDILHKLEDGEDFALMAKTYSRDEETAGDGGDLGLIDLKDEYVDPNVLQAAANLSIGESAGPIPVENGQAIIRLLEKHTTEALDERTIREDARKQLALMRANSLHDVEDELLAKYNAAIMPK
ncbi:peptidylprolyl isomerase [Paenibacillus solisilvae]|uniref:peptidylprolyl isomerase n=1 Tax=Paenibacillus solisilvae TaxID=2486751 RepID=A0ABW0W8H6_9BACL